MEKITAIITAGNEAHNIEGVLRSVSFADEIMLVDSYSTDDTVKLAKKHTEFILQRKYDTPALQKNWAIPQASHEWIILLDADERIDENLKNEIQEFLKKGTDKDAFWIKRQNHFMGQKVNYSGWQGDKVIRLFKKSTCRYKEVMVHEEIVTNGKVGTLKHKLQHYTYRGLDNYLAKAYRYTTWGAYDRLEKTKSITLFHLLVKPLFTFLKMYILKLGILDGKVGFILAVHSSHYIFERSLKIWRLKEGETLDKP